MYLKVRMRAIGPNQFLLTWTTASEQESFGSIRVDNLSSEKFCWLKLNIKPAAAGYAHPSPLPVHIIYTVMVTLCPILCKLSTTSATDLSI